MRRTQLGYGVLVPDSHSKRNVGAVDDDGLFITDLQTGQRRLVLSIAQASKDVPELRDLSEAELAQWEIYGFHCKWSLAGDRLIYTLRRYQHHGLDQYDAFARLGPEGVRYEVLTLRPDGSQVVDAVPAKLWELPGHHINFFPDGHKLSMNLCLEKGRKLDLVEVGVDGKNLRIITGDQMGSGHPSVHPDGRHIVTDTYAHERWTREGTTPLRWIDMTQGLEREIVRFGSTPSVKVHQVFRLDPHPAWDRSWRWLCFNAYEGGTRRVMLADLSELLEQTP